MLEEPQCDQVQTEVTRLPYVSARHEHGLGVFQNRRLTRSYGADREQMTGVGEKFVFGSFTTGAAHLILLGRGGYRETNRQTCAADGIG